MTHTPGPWEPANSYGSVEIQKKGMRPLGRVGRVFGYNAGVNTICLLNDGENINYADQAEMIGNARLIAAAPDLLAALQGMKHADGCFCEAAFSMPDGSHPAHSPECIAAMAAIAKTRGGEQ